MDELSQAFTEAGIGLLPEVVPPPPPPPDVAAPDPTDGDADHG